MAIISKTELESALTRLGQLAQAEGEHVDLLLLGGSVMVLKFQSRPATRDVDVVILSPTDRAKVRRFVETVAAERGWVHDWLNDGAKGFLVIPTLGATIMNVDGLTVRIPAIEQLLAMKLCAWRDDVDISDARLLLHELTGNRDEIWNRVQKHLQPGRELIASYAFDDLWESMRGSA